MIESIKEQLQGKQTNEALDELYEMGIIKDRQIEIYLIKKEFNHLWRTTNETKAELIKELSAKYDRSYESVYKYVK